MSLFDDLPDADPTPELELPPIQGTPRQYNWATVVRKRKLLDIGAFIASSEAYVQSIASRSPERAAKCQLVIDKNTARFEALCAETAANYWLIHRDNSVAELLDAAAAKPGQSFTWKNNERVEK